jgi:predicted ester cyclase
MTGTTLPDASDLARRAIAVIDSGDLGRTAALLDDRFQMHYHGVPDPISKAVFLDMLGGYLDVFPDMRHDVLDVLPSGEYVTLRLTTHATHRGTYEGIARTDRTIAVGAIHILRFADGRIVEWWAAEDDLGLLRQLGAVVAPPNS